MGELDKEKSFYGSFAQAGWSYGGAGPSDKSDSYGSPAATDTYAADATVMDNYDASKENWDSYATTAGPDTYGPYATDATKEPYGGDKWDSYGDMKDPYGKDKWDSYGDMKDP